MTDDKLIAAQSEGMLDRAVDDSGLLPFMSMVEKGDTCWNWKGAKNVAGYGNYQSKPAHRVAYEMLNGEIPEGLEIDHICKNRACVNPAHLEAVTQYENNMRSDSPTALNKRKTHCSNGHELNDENVKIVNRADGVRRKCRPCHRADVAQRKRRIRMEKLNAQPQAVAGGDDYDEGHRDGYEEGREAASEFDRDLRRFVFQFLEERGQIEAGSEQTAHDIFDCLVEYERFLKLPQPEAAKVALDGDYHKLCTQCWSALGISEYTGKHIVEHIREIVAQNETHKKAYWDLLESWSDLRTKYSIAVDELAALQPAPVGVKKIDGIEKAIELSVYLGYENTKPEGILLEAARAYLELQNAAPTHAPTEKVDVESLKLNENEQLRKERDELAAFIRQKHDVLEVPTEIFNLCIQNR